MSRRIIAILLVFCLLAACSPSQLLKRLAPAAKNTAVPAQPAASETEAALVATLAGGDASAAAGTPAANLPLVPNQPGGQPGADAGGAAAGGGANLPLVPNQSGVQPAAPKGLPPAAAAAPITATIPISYSPQPGSPVFSPNFVDTNLGCNFLGVGGQVFGKNNAPMVGLLVQVTGSLAGQPKNLLALTGMNDKFGPGGYLINLGNQPVASGGSLGIQIFDTDGHRLSDRFFFKTTAACEQNLVIMNFVERPPANNHYYLPFVPRRPPANTIFMPEAPVNKP